jgi:DNA modification methylase
MVVMENKITDTFAIYNGDCIEGMKSIGNNKIHLSVYSPPFGGLYHYSSNERDLSNCYDYDHFFEHYEFVVKEISRITIPGRISAVHCCDVPVGSSVGNRLRDFPGDIIRLHEKLDFYYCGRHTIWKEPLWVRRRTMVKNLAHMTIVDDAAEGGIASADYLLIFRKKGTNPIPIANPVGLDYYAGECPIPEELFPFRGWTGDQKLNRYSHWIWRRYASSIWDDIRMSHVLPFRDSKDPEDEKHVHALQLDIIDRVVTLRSNLGEVVLTPFMGVGSEVFSALKCGRKAIGFELKKAYFNQSLKNVNYVKETEEQVSLNLGLNLMDDLESE